MTTRTTYLCNLISVQLITALAMLPLLDHATGSASLPIQVPDSSYRNASPCRSNRLPHSFRPSHSIHISSDSTHLACVFCRFSTDSPLSHRPSRITLSFWLKLARFTACTAAFSTKRRRNV